MLRTANIAYRTCRISLLVLTTAMLPLGMLQADSESDYQAMQERLDAAILAGDITQLQAEERRQAFLRRHEERAARSEKLEAVQQRIREIKVAHQQGDLTDEEANEAIRATRAQLSTGETGVPSAVSNRKGIEQRLKRIRAAQAAGEMTDEEAKSAVRRVRLAFARQNERERADRGGEEHVRRARQPDHVKDCPETATEIGNCSRKGDEMAQRLRELRISHAEGHLTGEQAQLAYRQHVQAIREAVESGEMPANDGRCASRRTRALIQ